MRDRQRDERAQQRTSQYLVKTEWRGRTVDEWKLRVDGLDNHWEDCLVGAAMAPSSCGLRKSSVWLSARRGRSRGGREAAVARTQRPG